MPKTGISCCCICWQAVFADSWAIFKRFFLIIFTQVIGWAIFSYAEDGVNVVDCFLNPMKVADKVYPLSNETERASVLFYKLYNRTGHVLTANQSNEVYFLFKAYFKVPNQRAFMDRDRAILACVKWYRFSVVTMTTIGKLLIGMYKIAPSWVPVNNGSNSIHIL